MRFTGRDLLFHDVLPDPRGFVGFAVLTAVLLAHLLIDPGPDGFLFQRFAACAPASVRGPLLEAAFEGVGQTFLLLGPAIAFYAGLRRLPRGSDSLLPYVTVAGGGFLTLLTACALVAAAL